MWIEEREGVEGGQGKCGGRKGKVWREERECVEGGREGVDREAGKVWREGREGVEGGREGVEEGNEGLVGERECIEGEREGVYSVSRAVPCKFKFVCYAPLQWNTLTVARH